MGGGELQLGAADLGDERGWLCLDDDVAQGDLAAGVLEDEGAFGIYLALADRRVEVAFDHRKGEGGALLGGAGLGGEGDAVLLEEGGEGGVEGELGGSRAQRVVGGLGGGGKERTHDSDE